MDRENPSSPAWDDTLWEQLQFESPSVITWCILLVAIALAVAPLLVETGLRFRGRAAIVGLRLSAVLLLLLVATGVAQRRIEYERSTLQIVLDTSKSMQQPGVLESDTVSPSRWEHASRLLFGDEGLQAAFSDRYEITLQELDRELSAAVPMADYESRMQGAEGEESLLGEWLPRVPPAADDSVAILFISDGIVTGGQPLREVGQLDVPLYSIAPHPASAAANIAIRSLAYDRFALLGDRVTLNVELSAENLAGQVVAVTVTELSSEEVLAEGRALANDNGSTAPIQLQFPVTRAGTIDFVVTADVVTGGDIDPSDNQRSGTVQVREQPLRVLLVQEAPSYEFRFLKHAIERMAQRSTGGEPLLQFQSVLQSGDPRYAAQDRSGRAIPPVRGSELEAIDVFILSDADPRVLGTSLLASIAESVEQGAGLVVIAGRRHLPEAFRGTPLERLLPMPLDGGRWLEVNDGYAPQLTALGGRQPALDIEEFSWRDAPAFYSRWRVPDLVPGSQIWLRGGAAADAASGALLMTRSVGRGFVAFQATDESFRLAGFAPAAFERYWLQLIRAMARGRLQSDPMLDLDLEVLAAREPGLVVASFQAFGVEADVQPIVQLIRPDGVRQNIPVPGGQSDTRTRLQLKDLPSGEYELQAALDGQPETTVLQNFEILARPEEETVLPIDRRALRTVAENSAGTLLNVSNAVAELRERLPEGRQRVVGSLPPRPVWNHPLVVALLFGFLTTEWLLRRRWRLP